MTGTEVWLPVDAVAVVACAASVVLLVKIQAHPILTASQLPARTRRQLSVARACVVVLSLSYAGLLLLELSAGWPIPSGPLEKQAMLLPGGALCVALMVVTERLRRLGRII